MATGTALFERGQLFDVVIVVIKMALVAVEIGGSFRKVFQRMRRMIKCDSRSPLRNVVVELGVVEFERSKLVLVTGLTLRIGHGSKICIVAVVFSMAGVATDVAVIQWWAKT